MSENESILGSYLAPFSPATRSGPSGAAGQSTDQSSNFIREFLALKVENLSRRRLSTSRSQIYSTLNQGEIRILELCPGRFDEDLCGHPHVARIDFEYPRIRDDLRHTDHAISLPDGAPLWYTALSYTWGPPVFDVDFHFIDKGFIRITSSLATALRYLRSEHESVFLWIDQICIDQNNIREKEQQIPLMGLIYTHATNTVIWLGDEGDGDPRLAFDLLQQIRSRLQLFEGSVQPDDLERLHLPPLHKPVAPAWLEVVGLFQRDWFSRLWVIQEAVLSANLYIKCGRAVASWEDLAVWCETIRDSGIAALLDALHLTPEPRSGILTVHEVSSYRTYDQVHENHASLLEALVMSRYAKATNAKDKVYGVLGMSHADILPAYSDNVSVRDVYLEAALHIVPTALFRLLSCVDNDIPPHPSWVPDWGVESLAESLGFSTKTLALYSAGGTRVAQETYNELPDTYALEKDNTVLVLQGVLFDSIESLENIVKDPFIGITGSSIHTNEEWMTSIAMIEKLADYPNGDTVWDAFWQTIVAGKDASVNSKAPQEYSEILSLIVDEISGRELHIAGQPYSPRRRKGYFTVKSLQSRRPRETLDDLNRALRAALRGRRLAVTRKGYLCLVPGGTRIGDMVAVLKRAHIPLVVRNALEGNSEGSFQLIGETYVHGIMKGEALEQEDAPMQTVRLV